MTFLGNHGFTSAMIVAFGVAQLAGAALMVFGRSRLPGAVLVDLTFAISAVLLVIDGNLPLAIVTIIAMVLLGLIIRQSLIEWRQGRRQPTPERPVSKRA